MTIPRRGRRSARRTRSRWLAARRRGSMSGPAGKRAMGRARRSSMAGPEARRGEVAGEPPSAEHGRRFDVGEVGDRHLRGGGEAGSSSAPDGPSSPTTLASIEASITIKSFGARRPGHRRRRRARPVLPFVGRCGRERRPTSEQWRAGRVRSRGTAGATGRRPRAPLQSSVDLLGEITHQNVRHAFIMLA